MNAAARINHLQQQLATERGLRQAAEHHLAIAQRELAGALALDIQGDEFTAWERDDAVMTEAEALLDG